MPLIDATRGRDTKLYLNLKMILSFYGICSALNYLIFFTIRGIRQEESFGLLCYLQLQVFLFIHYISPQDSNCPRRRWILFRQDRI